jgi:hypothetical protein
MREKNNMKITKIILPLTITALSLFALETIAQQSTEVTREQYNRADSTKASYERVEAQTQRQQDTERMTDVKDEQSETKAKAKEAQRIENDANDAAKESKNALKSEKKAQKARKKADKQAKDAKDAREKSNLN